MRFAPLDPERGDVGFGEVSSGGMRMPIGVNGSPTSQIRIDVGFRLGISDHTDFTLEYNINRAKLRSRTLEPNELLATFRVGF